MNSQGYKKNLSPQTKVVVPHLQEVIQLMDSVFMQDGEIVPVYAEYLKQTPTTFLGAYCHTRGIYGVITHELIEFLKHEIGDAVAIEIGSGNGTLGKALGIPCTDNYCQTLPDVKEMYEKAGQPVIKYPDHVEKLSAIEAVEKYKPTVVIGSWITHKYDLNKHELGGNMYGVDENLMMRMGVKKYIMLGNEKTHWGKPLFANKSVMTNKLKRDFYFSRSLHPEKDVIFKFIKKSRK